MITQEYQGINSFLVGVSQYLLENAVPRLVRGCKTFEISHPVIIKIKNPLARHITIEKRHWNHILPYAESLWIALGRNDMELIGKYLNKLYDFSDDAISMRAAYGPRLRYYQGSSMDYAKSSDRIHKRETIGSISEIDQFKYIVKAFTRDPYTRQGIISITDPSKDYFAFADELKITKDFPCTNNLHFLNRGDSLDLIVNMRSNDFFWGSTGVNIFNFTFIQEYFAKILGLKVGHYYHVVNNLHYYEEFSSKVESLANIQNWTDDFYQYNSTYQNLSDFDKMLTKLEEYELRLSSGEDILFESNDDFFNDWAKVLYSFHQKHKSVEFKHPVLNLLNERKSKKNI